MRYESLLFRLFYFSQRHTPRVHTRAMDAHRKTRTAASGSFPRFACAVHRFLRAPFFASVALRVSNPRRERKRNEKGYTLQ